MLTLEVNTSNMHTDNQYPSKCGIIMFYNLCLSKSIKIDILAGNICKGYTTDQ